MASGGVEGGSGARRRIGGGACGWARSRGNSGGCQILARSRRGRVEEGIPRRSKRWTSAGASTWCVQLIVITGLGCNGSTIDDLVANATDSIGGQSSRSVVTPMGNGAVLGGSECHHYSFFSGFAASGTPKRIVAPS